jgi:hypothetical protein
MAAAHTAPVAMRVADFALRATRHFDAARLMPKALIPRGTRLLARYARCACYATRHAPPRVRHTTLFRRFRS